MIDECNTIVSAIGTYNSIALPIGMSVVHYTKPVITWLSIHQTIVLPENRLNRDVERSTGMLKI